MGSPGIDALSAAVGDILGPPLAIPVAKLVLPARVGEPPRRHRPLSPAPRRLGRCRGQHSASPVSADRNHHRQDRASQQQDKRSDDRLGHRTEDGRANTSANGKVGLYVLGLTLSLEQEPARLLNLEGCHRPPRMTSKAIGRRAAIGADRDCLAVDRRQRKRNGGMGACSSEAPSPSK
jgi:hypothetical protein